MGLRQRLMCALGRAKREEEGAVAVMAAVLAVALLASSALAVDVGRTAYVSRDQQGATDRATLDGVRLLHQAILDGVSAQQLVDQVYDTAVDSMETRNPAAGGTERRSVYRVDLGRVGLGGSFEEECRKYYLDAGDELPDDEDPSVHPACEGSVAALNVDAVRLWTHSEVGYVLPLGSQRSAELRKMAVATSDAIGSISAATTTGALEGGVINELLSALVRSDEVIDLALVGHSGIADVSVTLGDLLQSERLSVGTVDELLTAELSVLDVLHATADVLEAGDGDDTPNSAELTLAAALRDLAAAGTGAGLGPIRLGYDPETEEGILHLATGDGSGADLGLGALDLASAALQLANREHAVDLSLGAFETLPLELTVIQAPVTAIGHAGQVNGEWRTYAPSAQLELAIDLPIGPAVASRNDGSIEERVKRYRDRLTSASTCIARRGIVRDIEDELKDIEDKFGGTGLLTGAVSSLLSGVLDGLGGIVNCLFGRPTTNEVRSAIDDYEEVLLAIGDEALAQMSGNPQLTVTLGRGEVRLEEISCSDPLNTLLNAETGAAGVELPSTQILDASPLATVAIALDAQIASSDGHQAWLEAPYPSDPVRFSSGDPGLAQLIQGIDPQITLLDERLDSEHLMAYVFRAITPLLEGLDEELTAALDLLGVDLGVVEGRVLEVQCTGRRLIE